MLATCIMTPTGAPLWQVSEDNRGRWRDFPPDLALTIEVEYQNWLNGGQNPELVIAYYWRGEYEITFADMKQQHKTKGKEPPPRNIRRLIIPPGDC